jgi:hypothetical protein
MPVEKYCVGYDKLQPGKFIDKKYNASITVV